MGLNRFALHQHLQVAQRMLRGTTITFSPVPMRLIKKAVQPCSQLLVMRPFLQAALKYVGIANPRPLLVRLSKCAARAKGCHTVRKHVRGKTGSRTQVFANEITGMR